MHDEDFEFKYEYKCPTEEGYEKVEYSRKSLMKLYDAIGIRHSTKKLYSPSIMNAVDVFVKPMVEDVEMESGEVEHRTFGVQLEIQRLPSLYAKALALIFFPILFPASIFMFGLSNWKGIIQDFKDFISPKKNGKFISTKLFLNFKKHPEYSEPAMEFLSKTSSNNECL